MTTSTSNTTETAAFLSLPLPENSDDDRDATEIARRLTGFFTTLAQVTDDLLSSAPYLHAAVYQRIAPVTIPSFTGLALYLEQGICMPDNLPYRVRVYQILRQNDVLTTKIYKLKNEDDVVGAFFKPERIAALEPDKLDEQVGCSLIWTVDTDTFTDANAKPASYRGTTSSGCITQKGTRLQADAELFEGLLVQKDVGYDSDGKQVMGPPPAVIGHKFVKISASAIASQVSPLAATLSPVASKENSLTVALTPLRSDVIPLPVEPFIDW
jgi:hypothetical protein